MSTVFTPVFAIDAGHGPATAGKRSPDGVLREYAFNSAVASHVERLLAGYKCSFFRTDDPSTDVPLSARSQEANTKRCTAFVSIHANAFGTEWNASGGVETLIRDEDTSSERYKASLTLGLAVQRRIVAASGLRDRSIKQRKDLHILNAVRAPTILIEAGFMTNRLEAKLLQTPAYRLAVAECIVKALVEVYKLQKK